jgi:Pyridine nucleotide-disulphide oxidoreductase
LLRAETAQAAGAVALAEGDTTGALHFLRRAWKTWRELDAPYEAARVRVLLGIACRDPGDEDGAQTELRAAREVFQRLGAAPELARVERLVSRVPAADVGVAGLRDTIRSSCSHGSGRRTAPPGCRPVRSRSWRPPVRGRNVVVATGSFQSPRLPAFAAELNPEILQLHSSQYRRPAQLQQLQPGDVLVVGAANSGADIALELSRTHRTWLSGGLIDVDSLSLRRHLRRGDHRCPTKFGRANSTCRAFLDLCS